jgi:hypothetical protein
MIQTMQNQQSALAEVERLCHIFPDVPVEAIFKEDLLHRGMAWSHEALEISGVTSPKPTSFFRSIRYHLSWMYCQPELSNKGYA